MHRASCRLGLAAAVLLAIAARPGCESRPPAGPPDILLISVDTLRADHLSSSGYARPTSPFLDGLAAEGIRFEHAYATSSWTTPSVVSMLTSAYPSRHRMGGRFSGVPRVWSRIPEALPTLAESLRSLGYRTYGLAANVNLAAERGFDRGFDRYRCLGTADLDVVGRALGPWLEEIGRGEGPWFFWLHMLDPHGPYNGRRPWIESFEPELEEHSWLDGMPSERIVRFAERFNERQMDAVRALYDSEIRATDEFLRDLFERLPGADDAFVLFTSDHGEEFLEHGGMLHGRTLFDESVRIPLIVRLPDRRFAGAVSSGVVSLVDVVPTILAAAGAGPRDDAAGIDLVGDEGPAVPADRVVVTELLRGDPERAVREGRWKLIAGSSRPELARLYDLEEDPGEQTDVAGRFPDRVARLHEILADFERTHRPVELPAPTELTPEQIEALRALGYVGSD